MTLMELAQEALSKAIETSNDADDAFENAIRKAGYKSRWDWKTCVDSAPYPAYAAKVAADQKMHDQFQYLRNLERALA